MTALDICKKSMFIFLLLITDRNKVLTTIYDCYLKLATVNATSGLFDCQRKNRTNISTIGYVKCNLYSFNSTVTYLSLETLKFKPQIQQFSRNALRPFTKVRHLCLKNLDIDVLKWHVLAPLRATLLRLEVHNTKLRYIYNWNFAGLNYLHTIVLSCNEYLTCLADKAFEGPTSFEKIDHISLLHSTA